MFVLTESIGSKMKTPAIMFAICARFGGLVMMQADQLAESVYFVVLNSLGASDNK